MFLSIIVPAFNVENYIKKCIESIQNQDIDDCEIIIVNDCSTDKTMEIIQNLQSDNVVIINKTKNTGLSDTRNIGMAAAKGEYIMFVDSDDFLSNNVLKEIKSFVIKNKPDIVYLNYLINRKNNIIKVRNFCCEGNTIYEGSEFLKKQLTKRILPIPACFAVYKRNFINENNIRFKIGILHEDELWTPTCIMKAKKIGTLDLFFYNYVIRENSITQKKDKTKNGLDLLSISIALDNMTENINDNSLKTLLKNHVAMIYMKAVSRGKLFRKEFKKQVDRKFPLKRAYYLKDKLKAFIFFISPHLYCCIDRKFGNNI